MRLLNIDDFHFEEFFGSEIPRYGILSHRWSKDEVSHKDFLKGRRRDSIGYIKIVKFCDVIRLRFRWVKWVWVDTCCINKNSSTELTEAVNSMFNWYGRAVVCIVHMADVPDAKLEPEQHYRSFKCSQWFLRGWTLQELLTPREMRFYDTKWELIGTKRDLLGCISEITGISPLVLHDRKAIHFVSVAERMSWASTRTTTRIEDMAYCLLGIFDVNMTLVYGEGTKAFRRLQEEIIRTSDDQSILAWEKSDSMAINHSTSTWCGCLASSPAEFAKSGNIISGSPVSDKWRSAPYQITNRGLKIDIDYITVPNEPKVKYVALYCHNRNSKSPTFIALLGGEDLGGFYRSGKTFKAEDIVILLPEHDPQVKDGQFRLLRETVFLDLD